MSIYNSPLIDMSIYNEYFGDAGPAEFDLVYSRKSPFGAVKAIITSAPFKAFQDLFFIFAKASRLDLNYCILFLI